MHSPSRPHRPSLLAFTLWMSLNLASASVQSAQTEPASPAVMLPAVEPATGSNDTPGAVRTDPQNEREWSTGDRSVTVTLHKGTTLVIGPNSRVLRLPMIPTALGGKEFSKSAYSLELVSGRIDVDINPTLRPIYGVVVRTTRKVGAIVKVGRAAISVTPFGVTVAARSGRDMMIAINERWRQLRVGKAFVVNDKNPEGMQRALLVAPTAKIDRSIAIAIGSNITPQRLSWTEVAHSQGYVVRLYHQTDDTFTLVREQQIVETSLVLGTLKAGRYFATVSSLDESLLESGPSARTVFRVVEAVLPEGATFTGTAIQLPEAERLRLLEVDNLELSYGHQSQYFVPAPPSIGLHDGSAVHIRLREKGSTAETRLSLEPLDLMPTIELGPARAKWPGPPVTISILTRHRDGSPADADDKLVVSVTVNNEPVSLTWQKTLGKMTSQLEKPQFPGPWIVRVLLLDARGRPLSRDFLEVAPGQTQSEFVSDTP